jgi:hypothetical protein
MATVRHRISENDVVELRKQVEGWPRGSGGTVVAERGDRKLIEISDDQGVALDFISVPEAQLDLLFKHSD